MMGIVFALCGKVGSGKSTLAKFIADNYGAVVFSADKFMLKMHGEIRDRNIFESKLADCKSLIYELSDSVLKYANVVFDLGFWTKEERNFIINRFSGYKVVIIHTKLEDEVILERIANRNQNLADGEYSIDGELFKILSSKFEEPDEKESVIVYEDKNKLLNRLQEQE
jgi:predicted kinase